MAKRKTPDLPHVQHVTSNLKSPTGEPWTMELGQRTLLVGKNTSHKSAVVQAVELALTGAVDDIVGRVGVRDPALLLSLAPDDTLTSIATFNTDGVSPATFKLRREGDVTKKAQHDCTFDVTNILPHRQVKAALAGGEKTARKAFLEWISEDVETPDVLAHLPTTLHTKYQDISEKMSDGCAVRALLATLEYAGKRQREAAKEAKGANTVIESSSGDLDARPTDADIEAAEQACTDAQVTFDAAVLQTSTRSNADIEAELEHLGQELEQMAQEFNRQQDKRNELTDTARVADAAATILDWALAQKLEQCPCCSSQVGGDHIQRVFDYWFERRGNEQMHVHDEVTAIDAKLQQTQAEFGAKQHRHQELGRQRGTGTDDEATPTDLDGARQALTDTQARITQARNLRSQWDHLARMRDTSASMLEEAETYKKLKSACESAVGRLLADQADKFAQRVTTYLPKGWDFGIELKDGKREVFRMGLKRDDKLHCALSGAEGLTVTAAIAMATATDSTAPRVIIPEDRAWDRQTLAQVMRGFADYPGQIIMATTERPARKVPKGWTLIDMDEWLEGTIQSGGPEPEPEPEPESPEPGLPEDSGLTIRAATILESMGYELEQMTLMTPETAADLIRQGLKASQVVLTKSGKFRMAKTDNVLLLPPKPGPGPEPAF